MSLLTVIGTASGSRMSRSVVLAAAGIVGALCFPFQARAQGGFNGPGRYEITNLQSGKVLDMDRNDQTSVIQFSSRGTDNQIWDVESASGGFYSFRNTMNGNALEALGTGNSAPVRATRFDGRSSQQWRIDSGPGGNALIVSRQGKALDIPGGTSADGARVQIYDSNGESNQQFTFRHVSGDVSRNLNSNGNLRGNTANNAGTSNNPASGYADNRTQLKPGWNTFSVQQDVEVGQKAAGEIERQVPMLNDSRVDNYLNNLGQRLAAHAPGYKFPYSYRAVNDRALNAFALPGGHIYINRGVIEAADNESQLAAVMAHETSHVALRHGTNQASKSSAVQLPLSILGGLLGGNSTGAAVAQLGASFTVNSILMKYSRTDESQADTMGTQILYDSGFDPRGMSQFFEKIQAMDTGGNRVAFFNSHPNPDRRIESVNEEIARLGNSPRGSNTGSQEFNQIKRYVQSLPAASRSNQNLTRLQGDSGRNEGDNRGSRPEWASERFVTFENALLRIDYPDNWQTYGQGDAVTIAPRNGMVNDNNGNQALAYGALVNLFEPHSDRYGQQLQGPGFGQGSRTQDSHSYLEQSTDQLVQELRLSNRNMRVVRSHEDINIGGVDALSTYLSNDSPVQGGGRETNLLITLQRPEGLLFLIFTAPEREFQSYDNTFHQMLYSVRLKR